MNIQNMVASFPAVPMLPEKKETTHSTAAFPAGENGSASQLSPLAKMAYSYRLNDLAYNASQTSFFRVPHTPQDKMINVDHSQHRV